MVTKNERRKATNNEIRNLINTELVLLDSCERVELWEEESIKIISCIAY
jgi:hypothetical protein